MLVFSTLSDVRRSGAGPQSNASLIHKIARKPHEGTVRGLHTRELCPRALQQQRGRAPALWRGARRLTGCRIRSEVAYCARRSEASRLITCGDSPSSRRLIRAFRAASTARPRYPGNGHPWPHLVLVDICLSKTRNVSPASSSPK